MGSHRPTSKIFEEVFDAIPVQSTDPIWTIAGRARTNMDTARKYIDLILMIQGWPKVVEESIGQQRGYRRTTMAGRPKKG